MHSYIIGNIQSNTLPLYTRRHVRKINSITHHSNKLKNNQTNYTENLTVNGDWLLKETYYRTVYESARLSNTCVQYTLLHYK